MQAAFEIKRCLGGKRGRALIINIIEFKAEEQYREGAIVDEENLTDLFTGFNYEVVVYNKKITVQVCWSSFFVFFDYNIFVDAT